jgi:hypothetical protein
VIANNQYLEFLSCQFVEHLRVRSTNEIQLQHNPACQPAKHPAYLLNNRTPSSVEIRLKHDLRCPHQMPSSIVIRLGARKVVATAMCSINILYIYTNTNTHTIYIYIEPMLSFNIGCTWPKLRHLVRARILPLDLNCDERLDLNILRGRGMPIGGDLNVDEEGSK